MVEKNEIDYQIEKRLGELDWLLKQSFIENNYQDYAMLVEQWINFIKMIYPTQENIYDTTQQIPTI